MTGSLPLAAWMAWVAFCLLAGLPVAFRGWADAVAALGAVGWREVLAAHPVAALVAHAQVLAIAFVVAAGWAGAGAPVLAWLGTPDARRWERAVLALLLGFATLGAALLGIALTGLFVPGVVAVVALAGLALPGARTAIAAMAQARPRLPATIRGWVILGLIPTAIPLLAALTPDVHMDAYTYHLALPEQILRVHKFTAEGLSLARGYPLAAELIYSTAVISGRDAVAHWLDLLAFVASMCFLAGWVSRLAGPTAGWLAVGVTLTMGLVVQLAILAKNDLVAAAYPVAGVVCLARGWLGIAAVLFGCGGTVKWNGFVFAAVALPMFGRLGIRGFLGTMGLMAMPVLPWFARSWLWMGDPVWPALSRWLPGVLWDAPSQASVTIVRRAWGLKEGILTGPPDLVRTLILQSPALACVLPLALVGIPRVRGVAWYAIAGLAGCAVAMPVYWIRLGLPAIILLAATAAVIGVRIAVRWPGRGRAVAVAGAALAVWLPVGGFVVSADPAHRLPMLTGAWSEDRFLAESLTTYRTLAGDLSRLIGRSRLIGFSDVRHYRLPGRYLEECVCGRSWAWTLARDSMTPDRILIRWRQLGVRYALENFVAEGARQADAAPFLWDERMLVVWRGFVGRHLAVVVPAAAEDDLNGGFVIWTVRRRPLDRDPAWLSYLPGLDALIYGVTRHGMAGDPWGWLSGAQALAQRVPHVDFMESLVGVGYYSFGRHAEAYRALLPGVLHGSVSDDNFWMAGTSALILGRTAEARRFLARAAELDTDHRAEALSVLERLGQAGATREGHVGPRAGANAKERNLH